MTNRDNDEAFVKMLIKYWAERGYEVKVWTEAEMIKGDLFYCVRTDMVNGLPKDFKAGDRI